MDIFLGREVINDQSVHDIQALSGDDTTSEDDERSPNADSSMQKFAKLRELQMKSVKVTIKCDQTEVLAHLFSCDREEKESGAGGTACQCSHVLRVP